MTGDPDDGARLDYYWWSRLVYGLAANLHWSEGEILSLRWDRALSYAAEIQIDLGGNPDRPEPELPEEQELAQALRREMGKHRGAKEKTREQK